jgi:hypothetical protein
MRLHKDEDSGEFVLELDGPGHPVARSTSLSVLEELADYAENNVRLSRLTGEFDGNNQRRWVDGEIELDVLGRRG